MITSFAPNGNLLISLDEGELPQLKYFKEECEELGKNFESDAAMIDWFDSFIANSEYEWIIPENVGALTSAPMLGIWGDDIRRLKDEEEVNRGNIHVGGDEEGALVVDVVKSWAFMPYQVQSVLGTLLKEGITEWTKG